MCSKAEETKINTPTMITVENADGKPKAKKERGAESMSGGPGNGPALRPLGRIETLSQQKHKDITMATSSPRAASPGASYFSTIRGGASPSSSSSPYTASSLTAATAAAASAALSVPPPPFPDNGSSEETKLDDNNNDVHNTSSALNSTPYLQSRLVQLRTQSQDLSTELTKKLATSRSGQSLLHIGPSLSTLPPDLSSLLEALSPLISTVEQYESDNRVELDRLVSQGREVQCAVKKREFSLECAEIYSDLMGAEEVLRWKNRHVSTVKGTKKGSDVANHMRGGYDENMDDDDDDWSSENEKDEGKCAL